MKSVLAENQAIVIYTREQHSIKTVHKCIFLQCERNKTTAGEHIFNIKNQILRYFAKT